MTAPDSPRLDCPTGHTDRPHAAPQPVDRAAEGEPKSAARKGVITALHRSNRSPARPGTDPTPDTPGIRVFAPPVYRNHYDGARWSTRPGALPTAAYACACGQTGTATGLEAVAALVAEHDAHRSACTGAPAATPERRAAA
ncbi:hypothetical protein [Streptomyces violaceus]|uniref:Uncharacterized protein n=1 Tax=Streptomyces violaceus TaxID=1936 RepID=A0ABY9UA91_STRVL|nr:hypothetical protein [Streptomyces janthinus]WND19787.1 hypothetical protein RI060_21590 [Streptomyces janthinus]GGS92418.1 hypothetical protein GCM10010270_75700 [Streptomyces janthinus]